MSKNQSKTVYEKQPSTRSEKVKFIKSMIKIQYQGQNQKKTETKYQNQKVKK